MNINQVAIIVIEDEQTISKLAKKMHVWVAATEKNKEFVKSLWKLNTPKELTISHYDVPLNSSSEEMCLFAIELVESHHSSVFSAEPWHEIQVHGCGLTEILKSDFLSYGNTTITKQNYGFNVIRPCE